ncbi:hypothetical protein ISS08_01180 [Candidatus Pacearchaeota archaeon]|nr:hypothetical protein [Candidatus Pacearchaeota archaeon]
MAVDIHKLIATINPDLYHGVSIDKSEGKKELITFKKLIQSEGIQKAAESANPNPDAQYQIGYDSAGDTLEPIYFFIVDLMDDFGLKTEKIFDSFTSSPGSGHFGELGSRATVMQQQGSKILGDINVVLRSVLNIVYDLRDFKMRLEHYSDLKNNKTKEAALLALKQIWMDKVDISKGNSSIKAMALGQAGYQTLIDAFLFAKDAQDVNKLDLNDRVKRILMPRVQEFSIWVTNSEKELQKRYNIEKSYLRSQVNSLKLYSRWAKPYLIAAHELEMGQKSKEPALVKAFNTIMLDLTLLGKSPINPKNAALAGDLPKDFSKLKIRRGYNSVVIVDFKFRGIPQRIGGAQSHYVFGGKTNMTFSAYALNDEELERLNKELDDSSLGDVLNLIEGSTTESLGNLEDEINLFLDDIEPEPSAPEKAASSNDSSNPFLALIGSYNGSSSKQASSPSNNGDLVISPDNFLEKGHLRPFAQGSASDTAFALFDIYKKAHGMVSYT